MHQTHAVKIYGHSSMRSSASLFVISPCSGCIQVGGGRVNKTRTHCCGWSLEFLAFLLHQSFCALAHVSECASIFDSLLDRSECRACNPWCQAPPRQCCLPHLSHLEFQPGSCGHLVSGNTSSLIKTQKRVFDQIHQNPYINQHTTWQDHLYRRTGRNLQNLSSLQMTPCKDPLARWTGKDFPLQTLRFLQMWWQFLMTISDDNFW